MKKRIFSLILVVIIALSVPFSASAAASDINLYGFRNYDSEQSGFAFVSLSPQAPAKLNEASKQEELSEILCGTSFGGNIYAVDENGLFYKIDTVGFNRNEIGTAIEDISLYRPAEMAYDNISGKMYLLCLELENNEANALFTVDINSGEATFQRHIIGAAQLKGLSFDGSGTLYGIGENGTLYKIDPQSGRAYTIGSTGYSALYIQSMCFDRITNSIYWAYYNGEEGKLISVDPATAIATELGVLGKNAEITALCMASDAYLVNIESEEGGIAYVSGDTYFNSGEKAALVAEVTNGYSFGGWAVNGGTLSTSGELSTTLTMPASDVTVKAFFLPKKVYQERTLYNNSAKFTLSGKKVYYNSTLEVSPWASGMDGYDLLLEEMGEKRTLISADAVSLTAMAVEETPGFKKSVRLTIPVPSEYEGRKVNVFTYNGEKISKTSEKVKDGQITLKLKEVGPIAITSFRGGAFFAILLLVLLTGSVGFLVYAFRDVIKSSLKKDIGKIKTKVKIKKAKHQTEKQSEQVFAALDEQDLENSRYNIK